MYNFLMGKKYLPYRIALGFILGIIVGLFFYDFSLWIKPAGTLFMNLIKMLIVPVIFFSVTSGIAAIGDVQKLKRVGGKVVLVYVAMTVLACLIGIVLVNIVHPGANFDLTGMKAFDPSKVKAPNFGDFLFNMVPTNIVDSMVKGDIMQLIFFTVLFGIALVYIGDKAKRVVQVCSEIASVIYKMLDIIMGQKL
jgi:Na+/H+-dicarboxylate symporters